MSRRTCGGELVLRERRGALLGDAERIALDAHLAMCESCRVLYEMGGALNRLEQPERDDGARIQWLSQVAEQWARRGVVVGRAADARRFRRRVAVLIAASVALVSGVAVAEFGAHAVLSSIRSHLIASLSRVPASPSSGHLAPAALSGRDPSEHSAPLTPAAVESSMSQAQSDLGSAPSVPSAPKRPSPRPTASLGEGAAALFEAANDARRGGDTQQATTLYRELQRLYPGSPEAGLTYVSLGGLLLDAKQPKAALAQFDRALRAPAETLRPEALYGRARALAALHEAEAEKAAWKQLLEEFPTCPYAQKVPRRLAE
jgi:TolA-binding protein